MTKLELQQAVKDRDQAITRHVIGKMRRGRCDPAAVKKYIAALLYIHNNMLTIYNNAAILFLGGILW